MTNNELFKETYMECLREAVQKFPEQYSWKPGVTVEEVARRMHAAIDRNSFSKDSPAFRMTCRKLGIKHTYKAIAEFIAQ